jgi:predicted ferric reductase
MKFANNSKLGLFIVIFLSFVPIAFWFPYANFSNPIVILRSIGQATALMGTVLFCLNFVLATRWRFLEHIFFGLNRVYIAHHLIGAIGFVLLLIHPISLFFSYMLISPQAARIFITPSRENSAVFVGSLALVTFVILLVFTLFIRPEYDRWKKTHQWLGLSLLLASLHGFQIGSTLSQSLPLRIYIYGFFVVAMVAFVYRFIQKSRTGNKLRYIVERVVTVSGITKFDLKPTSEADEFCPWPVCVSSK